MSAARAITTLDSASADRLIRLLGMLGSAHDGEIANAGRMADRLVRGLGLTWRDVITSTIAKHQPYRPRSVWCEPRTVRESIGVALVHLDLLTGWERRFVLSVRDAMRHSDKQRMVLSDIIDKLRDLHMGAAA